LMSADSCAACGGGGLEVFYEVTGLPAQTCVLLDTREAAERYPTGDLRLGCCPNCGFIQNLAYDPELVDYSQPTEESQAFSGKFQTFAHDLARDLVDTHGLVGKSVLEVGCGKGDFLLLLADCGIGQGVGIDPGYLANRPETQSGRIEFIRGWYDAGSTEMTADLVLSRHLMEHVPNVGEFLRWLAASTKRTPGAVLFTEVPDTHRVLEEGAFWDVYYEHCSYFTAGSLSRALASADFEVTDVKKDFEDQYLLATARPGIGLPLPGLDDPATVAASAARFSTRSSERISFWRDTINRELTAGREVAVWGGGSKAVAFLTTLDVGPITVVDINPHKQGKWLPTLGIEVESPQALVSIAPELVIPMNAAYVEEIGKSLEAMGLSPKVLPV
jgi:SAM-dependent methyltransferase